MGHLVDTSVLMRLANQADANHQIAASAVMKLHRAKEQLFVAPQNLIEFRNVATRPLAVNGLGLSTAAAEAHAAQFEADFILLPETPDIFTAWKDLVHAGGVIGKRVHDARLVAMCQANAITHVLTFNVGDFVALAKFVPGLTVADPQSV